MPSLRHTHQYVLHKARSKGKPFSERIFKCNDPHCSHYNDSESILGKASICNMCGSQFVLDREALLNVKPRCLFCSNTKKGRAAQAAKKIIGNLKTLSEPEEVEIEDDEMENLFND